MSYANKNVLGGLVLSVIFLSSCSSLIKKAEPAFDQVNGLAELRLVLDEKFSPQFDNTVSFPLVVNVGDNPKELAFVSVSGATEADPNAVVSIQAALENYLSFVGDVIAGHEIISQLPNGLGHLSRLKGAKSKTPFLTASGLWAIAVGPQGGADASKANGMIYLPVLTDAGTLPEKAFFGGVVRFNIFNGNSAYQLPAMLTMELTNNGEVFGVVGAFGAGDQSTGEFPGLIAAFELNALKRAAGSDGVVIRQVDFSESKDAFVLGEGVNKSHDELMTYFGDMLDGMKSFSWL